MVYRSKLGVLLLTALLFTAAGCVSGVSVEHSQDKDLIRSAVNDWEAAIEAYDLDGMTQPLTNSFTLTLLEGGSAYTKTRSDLEKQLEADKKNQLNWRDDYGYALDLELHNVVVDVSNHTATVTSDFRVLEEASGTTPPIDRRVTDTGRIKWEFVKASGQWRISGMVIEFITSNTVSATVRSAEDGPGKNPFFRSY